MVLYYPPTTNGLQKTLDVQLDEGETGSMTLNNVTGIQNKPGVVLINRIDTNGTEKSASLREWIKYTAVSGSTLTGLTRAVGGSSDQDHAVGSVVEFVPDVTVFQAIMDALDGTATGVNLNAPTITSPTINVGSDAQGDIYYRNGSNAFTRLAAGTDGQVLRTQGASANPTWSTITESLITLADNTTNDVSTSKHGFVPKAPNDTTKFLRGDGTWQTASSGGSLIGFSSTALNANFTNSFTKVVEVSLTTTVTSKIIIIFDGLVAANSTQVIDTQVQLKEGSTIKLGPQQSGGNSGTTQNQFSVHATYAYELAAGSYTFSAEMKNSANANQVNVGVVNLTVIAVPV